jgi:hypothetical protein
MSFFLYILSEALNLKLKNQEKQILLQLENFVDVHDLLLNYLCLPFEGIAIMILQFSLVYLLCTVGPAYILTIVEFTSRTFLVP